MKLKLLAIVLILGLIQGCSKKDEKGELVKVQAFNLMDQNAEIPDVCKPPLATEENKRSFVKFRGKVNRCVDLVNQFPELGTFENISECLADIGSTFSEVSDATCRQTVTQVEAPGNAVEVINLLRDRFYDMNVLQVENSQTVFAFDELTKYFSILSAWFDVATHQFYPEDSEFVSRALQDEIYTNVVKRFWDDLQSYSTIWRETFGEIVNPIPSTDPVTGEQRTPEEIQEIRLQKNLDFRVFETMVSVNQKVLESLFASDLANDKSTWGEGSSVLYPSALMASMIGEAVNPLMQRMRTILKIYDIACKLDNCEHSLYTTNQAFWILQYFNNIASGTPQVSYSFNEEDESSIRSFMEILDVNRAVLERINLGFQEAFGVSNIASATSGSDMPHLIQTYKWVFEEGLDLMNNYESTRVTDGEGIERAGLFTTNRIGEVNIGFSGVNVKRHVDEVESANNSLIALRETFNGQKHTLIQEALNLNSSLVRLEDLESQINIDVTEMINQKNQIDAVRSFIADRREEYSKQVLQVINDPNVIPADQHFFPHPAEIFQVDAASIQPTTDSDFTGAILRNLDATQSFSSGDVIQLQVSGEWSPTCAVSGTYGSQSVGALAGPRGFTLVNSEGSARVSSVNRYRTRESFSSNSLSVKSCVGGSFNFGITASLDICASATTGSRRARGTTTSTTNSQSNRTDASFQLGITLENTPFSNYPAGSLLLVEVPRNSRNPNDVRRAYVVQQNSTFTLENDDSDYLLIGNDCRLPSNSGSLTVTMNRLEPQGALAADFATKVTALGSELETQVAGLISTGQLSYNVLENIRQQMRALSGPDINGFSGQMRTLLESIITNEIAILDFKSQLVKMERALETRRQRVLSLLDQFGIEDEQRELRVQTRNWLLANLDLDFVNTAGENQSLNTLNRILNILDNSLVSYIDFKYRNTERSFIVGNTQGLSSIAITDSFDSIAQNITVYTQQLLQRLEDDLANRPRVPKTSIGIRIPNPFYEPSVSIPFPDEGLYPVLETSRAFAFWDALVNPLDENGERKTINLGLGVDDLYTTNGLACYVQAPIVESMGMYFVPENEGYVTDYNNVYSQRNAKYLLEGVSVVPYQEGPSEYNFVNPVWRFFDVANRMAVSSNDGMRRLTTEFPPSNEVETGLGTGRPLFGDWEVGDVPSHRIEGSDVFIGQTPVKEIREVFLGFVISAQNADFNANLPWINYCAN